jgi:hypothetical protein
MGVVISVVVVVDVVGGGTSAHWKLRTIHLSTCASHAVILYTYS